MIELQFGHCRRQVVKMGYRGKISERHRAQELRAQAWTLQAIAEELGVAKSSVSMWVRDIEFTPNSHGRTAARRRGPNKLERRKEAEILYWQQDGRRRIGQLSDREFLVAGVALYAGEGAKTNGAVGLANTDPAIIAFFCAWLRRFFDIDESRLRARLYLHEGLDLAEATDRWSALTSIPQDQFLRPYRARADETRRRAKHTHGCVTVTYSRSRTHRQIIGLIKALLRPEVVLDGDALVSANCC
jgi:hypothetical protein